MKADKIEYIDYEWKNLLENYGRLHQDIATIFVGKNIFGNEFVIVVDSVITQDVFEHNDFCFDLCEDYTDIDNFIVLDIEEFSCMELEYRDYKKVYQRVG